MIACSASKCYLSHMNENAHCDISIKVILLKIRFLINFMNEKSIRKYSAFTIKIETKVKSMNKKSTMLTLKLL